MRSQDVGAAEFSTFRGNPLAALDRLPQPIRRAIHEGVCAWDPRVERWQLNKLLKAGTPPEQAIAQIVEQLRAADAGEVWTFAHHWPARFGRLTPHVRAEATIVRYDEVARVRAAREARDA